MILTRPKILEEIKKCNIVIEPFDIKHLGPASYDIALSSQFRVFYDKVHDKDKLNKKSMDNKNQLNTLTTIELKPDYNINDYTKSIKAEHYTLKPGEFILGISEERIQLAENIAAFLTGRSRYARLGLVVHATANFIQPGVNNKQVLEIRNLSHRTLVLTAGLRIAQIIFIRCEANAKYQGRYKDQCSII